MMPLRRGLVVAELQQHRPLPSLLATALSISIFVIEVGIGHRHRHYWQWQHQPLPSSLALAAALSTAIVVGIGGNIIHCPLLLSSLLEWHRPSSTLLLAVSLNNTFFLVQLLLRLVQLLLRIFF
jgi:hypothetical protein